MSGRVSLFKASFLLALNLLLPFSQVSQTTTVFLEMFQVNHNFLNTCTYLSSPFLSLDNFYCYLLKTDLRNANVGFKRRAVHLLCEGASCILTHRMQTALRKKSQAECILIYQCRLRPRSMHCMRALQLFLHHSV